MEFLKLFIKIMLQNINQGFDNSHFCDSRVLFYVRMFLRTVYEKIQEETSVQLGSDILILLKYLAGRSGFNDILYSFFCDIKSWNLTRNPIQMCFYWKCFENESITYNNRVVILRTVNLTVG